MPLLIFFFLVEVDPVLSLYLNGNQYFRVIGVMVLNTVVGPILSIYVLYRQGLIDDYTLPTLRGRSLVYLLSLVYYSLTWYLFQSFRLPAVLEQMILGLILILAVLSIVSRWYKVSAHMTAAGGLLAILTWLFTFYGIFEFSWVLIGLTVAGLIGTARLVLEAHDLAQLWWGLLIGYVGIYTSLQFVL